MCEQATKLNGKTMSLDDFRRLPRQLGWRYEYIEGQVRISPGYQSVVALRPPGPLPRITAPCTLRAVEPGDAPALESAYCEAFAHSVDFFEAPPEEICRSAGTDIRQSLHGGKCDEPLPASRLALDRGRVVGAALLLRTPSRLPYLNLLFVVPERRRAGLASALFVAAMTALAGTDRVPILSQYRLANAASRAWHHRLGFIDQIDQNLARAYMMQAAERLEQLQACHAPRSEQLAARRERDDWLALIRKLDDWIAVIGPSAVRAESQWLE